MPNDRVGSRERVAVVLKRSAATHAPGPSGAGGVWRSNADAFANMLPITGWKLWYGDGSAVNSLEQPWEGAPRGGVQVVCYYHGEGYRTYSYGYDEYVLPSSGECKLGELITDEDFQIIKQRAHADDWRP